MLSPETRTSAQNTLHIFTDFSSKDWQKPQYFLKVFFFYLKFLKSSRISFKLPKSWSYWEQPTHLSSEWTYLRSWEKTPHSTPPTVFYTFIIFQLETFGCWFSIIQTKNSNKIVIIQIPGLFCTTVNVSVTVLVRHLVPWRRSSPPQCVPPSIFHPPPQTNTPPDMGTCLSFFFFFPLPDWIWAFGHGWICVWLKTFCVRTVLCR